MAYEECDSSVIVLKSIRSIISPLVYRTHEEGALVKIIVRITRVFLRKLNIRVNVTAMANSYERELLFIDPSSFGFRPSGEWRHLARISLVSVAIIVIGPS